MKSVKCIIVDDYFTPKLEYCFQWVTKLDIRYFKPIVDKDFDYLLKEDLVEV